MKNIKFLQPYSLLILNNILLFFAVRNTPSNLSSFIFFMWLEVIVIFAAHFLKVFIHAAKSASLTAHLFISMLPVIVVPGLFFVGLSFVFLARHIILAILIFPGNALVFNLAIIFMVVGHVWETSVFIKQSNSVHKASKAAVQDFLPLSREVKVLLLIAIFLSFYETISHQLYNSIPLIIATNLYSLQALIVIFIKTITDINLAIKFSESQTDYNKSV